MSTAADQHALKIWVVKDFARDQRCAFLYYHRLASLALDGDSLEFGHLVKLYLRCAAEAEEDFVRSALILRLMRRGWDHRYALRAVLANWGGTFEALQELTGVAIIDVNGDIDKRLVSKASMMLEKFSLN
jgi:hypothetical protein